MGVEVGLGSNARKNRVGKVMETIIEEHIKKLNQESDMEYILQARIKDIKEKWGIKVRSDKSNHTVDFAVYAHNKLFFIEVNFYSGGGSKLKSTAGEYRQMNTFGNKQNIVFIWITDGAGWKNTLSPLEEYFYSSDYLLNLDMVRKGALKHIIDYER